MNKGYLRLFVVLGLCAAVVGLIVADRLLLWMERKGWISYRSFNPSVGAKGVMGTFQEIIQPEVRHVEEEKRQRKAEQERADAPSED